MIHVVSDADIQLSQRTSEGRAFEKRLAALKKILRGTSKEDREKAKRMNAEFLRMKEVGSGTVHANQFLSNFSVKYVNDEMIGDRILTSVPVAKRSNTFVKYDKRDQFNTPNDELGERAKANEITKGRSTDTYAVKDYGLQDFVRFETIANEDAPFDEMLDACLDLQASIALKREIRQASVLTTTANYSGNTAALSGSDMFDAAGSDPAKKVRDARASLFMGGSNTKLICFMGLDVYNVLVQHPKLIDLFKYVTGGFANRQKLAEYFEVDEVLVGASRYDSANSGQTASYSRIWGKVLGIVRVNPRPTLRSAHFGSTFRLTEDPVVTSWIDPSVGKRGGYYLKHAVSEDYKVVAGDTGFLYTTVIA